MDSLKEHFPPKEMSLEDRIKRLEEQTRHPLYKKFVDHCMERYGEHPMVLEMRDLSWQIEHGFGDDENEPPEGPVNPRYGRVTGRDNFWPFTFYLEDKVEDELEIVAH